MPPLFPGSGALKGIVHGAIAAGANGAFIVPTHARWHLIAARLVLDCDATVSTRRCILNCYASNLVYFRPSSLITQVASQTMTYWFSINPVDRALAEFSEAPVALADHIILRDTASIRSDISNLQAGDQIMDFRILVHEWIEPE